MKLSNAIPFFVAIVSIALASCSDNGQARSQNLQQVCIDNDIRSRLKDPKSLRVLDTEHHNSKDADTYEQGSYTDFVYITYTATNSYGGRVKGIRNCGFIGDTLVMAMNANSPGEAAPIGSSDFILYRSDLVK